MPIRLFHVAQAVLILVGALQQAGPVISAPVNGQVLQGQVTVTGSAAGDGFSYAELAFAYASDPTDTWFLIQTIIQPVTDASLNVWDTSVLTDGDYRLRLRLYLLDGSYQDFTVEDLHVRNQAPPTGTPPATRTPGFTPSPLPSEQTGSSTEPPSTSSSPTASLERRPTPVPLPTNPAAITTRSVFSFLGRGALLSLILFVVLGLLLRLRRS